VRPRSPAGRASPDTAADGHYAGAWYLLTAGVNWHNVQHNLGAGERHDLDLDMAESAYIQYEGSNELSCSSYALAPAKG
jgi:hypothetical protein